MVSHCPLCNLEFGGRDRRHHCRLCGRIICNSGEQIASQSDLSRGPIPPCSLMLPVRIPSLKEIKPTRICSNCDRILFHRDRSPRRTSQLTRLNEELWQTRLQLCDLTVRFDEALERFEVELSQSILDREKIGKIKEEALVFKQTIQVVAGHVKSLQAACLDDAPQLQQLRRNMLETTLAPVQRQGKSLLRLNELARRLELRQQAEAQAALGPRSSVSIKTSRTPSICSDSSSMAGSLGRMLLRFAGSNETVDGPQPIVANRAAILERLQVLLEQKEQLMKTLADAVKQDRHDDVRSLRSALLIIDQEISHQAVLTR